MKIKLLTLLLAAGFALDASAAPQNTTINFSDNQADGWAGRVSGLPALGLGTYVDSSLGNDAPALRTTYNDFLKVGVRFYTDSSAFTGDYSKLSSVTIGIDVNTLKMARGADTQGAPLVNDFFLDLNNFKQPADGFESSTLSFKMGALSQGNGWTHYSVTFDPRAITLGDQWSKVGDKLSTQQILSSIDELAFHIDGGPKFLGATSYDVAIDNISISAVTAVPEPATGMLTLGGLGFVGMALARRKRKLQNS